MKKYTKQSGYTLAELAVVIVVLSVLSIASYIGYGSIQTQVRDKERASSATIIAEALEKYYQKHGEYPGVSAVTANNSSIATTLGIPDKNVLVAPKANSGTLNSLTSTDLTASTADAYAYLATCDTSSTCVEWQLQYREESSGNIKVIESRGKAQEVAAAPTINAPSPPVVKASLVGSNVVGSIDIASECTEGLPEYRMQSRQNGGAWSAWTSYNTQAGTTISVALTSGVTYGFRAIARCADGATLSEDSDYSNEAEYYQAPSPTTPTMSAALSGSNAVGTSSAITCSDGLVAEYQLRFRINGGAWSAWTSWSTTRTISAGAAAQGYLYEFQAVGRCGSNGVASPGSNVASYIHPIAAPAVPSITAGLSGSDAIGTISAIGCPSGSTAQYQMQARYNTSAWGAFSAWGTTRTGSLVAKFGARHQFIGNVRCVSTYATGATSTTGTASYVRPFNAVSESGGTLKAVSGGYTWDPAWTFSHTSPTSGMTIEKDGYQCRKHRVSDNTWASWSSDWTGSASNAGDSKCGYVSCSKHDNIQIRYQSVYATSNYDTGPSIEPRTNTPGCKP